MMRNSFDGIGALLKTPVGVIVAANAVWHAVVWWLGIKFSYAASLIMLAVDIAAAYLLLDRLTYFFSQFILPIQNPKHRREIFQRVRDFESGSRGPALFIRNGQVIAHEGEAEKRGPGLIVLDTASAAVLRTDTEVKDTIGPGIKFTRGEYIAGSVDLRAQWKYIGPNTFSAHQTQAKMRDGTEVSATISIKFSLKRPRQIKPTESGVVSQYQYDEDAVRRAILREIIEVDGKEKTPMAWDEFPAHLVANIWREYAQKFKFAELFSANPHAESGLQLIEKMINLRVRQSQMEALDDMGNLTGVKTENREFRELQERGLEIHEVRIHNVHFDSPVEDQLIAQWNPDWLKSIQQEEKALSETEALIGTVAREEASKNFARLVARAFGAGLTAEERINPYMTLQALIKPLREFMLEQNSAGNNMDPKLRKLEELWKWLLDSGADLTRSREGK